MRAFANPAREQLSKASELYPYYAGFSDSFARDALAWAGAHRADGMMLDPWNGSGTTTRTAATMGFQSLGLDLNPVMVLVAKANSLDPAEAPVLVPLAKKLIGAGVKKRPRGPLPLEVLLERRSACTVVGLATAIWQHLVDDDSTARQKGWLEVAPLAAVFLVALFNALRATLHTLGTSNPTWLKIPNSDDGKVGFDAATFHELFLAEVSRINLTLSAGPHRSSMHFSPRIQLADSRNLPLAPDSVDGIVTSPPYCTRLDYGRTTMPELLVLESLGAAAYEESRAQLMGSAVSRKTVDMSCNELWGDACRTLLERIRAHPSKASSSYYYRTHLAYFDDIYLSLKEIARTLRKEGRMCLVAQDSFYKDVHNDLPQIISEMSNGLGLRKVNEFSYDKKKSMCTINRGSTAYRVKRTPREAALLFEKE